MLVVILKTELHVDIDWLCSQSGFPLMMPILSCAGSPRITWHSVRLSNELLSPSFIVLLYLGVVVEDYVNHRPQVIQESLMELFDQVVFFIVIFFVQIHDVALVRGFLVVDVIDYFVMRCYRVEHEKD